MGGYYSVVSQFKRLRLSFFNTVLVSFLNPHVFTGCTLSSDVRTSSFLVMLWFESNSSQRRCFPVKDSNSSLLTLPEDYQSTRAVQMFRFLTEFEYLLFICVYVNLLAAKFSTLVCSTGVLVEPLHLWTSINSLSWPFLVWLVSSQSFKVLFVYILLYWNALGTKMVFEHIVVAYDQSRISSWTVCIKFIIRIYFHCKHSSYSKMERFTTSRLTESIVETPRISGRCLVH